MRLSRCRGRRRCRGAGGWAHLGAAGRTDHALRGAALASVGRCATNRTGHVRRRPTRRTSGGGVVGYSYISVGRWLDAVTVEVRLKRRDLIEFGGLADVLDLAGFDRSRFGLMRAAIGRLGGARLAGTCPCGGRLDRALRFGLTGLGAPALADACIREFGATFRKVV